MRPVLMLLAAVVALGASGCANPEDPADEATIVITIEHSKFIPDAIDVPVGRTVRFVVRNRDPIDHEFIVGDRSVQLVHERGTEAHHGAKPGEISIPAGSERQTFYTFGQAGELIYGCHLPGHYAFGMRGTIRVSS